MESPILAVARRHARKSYLSPNKIFNASPIPLAFIDFSPAQEAGIGSPLFSPVDEIPRSAIVGDRDVAG